MTPGTRLRVVELSVLVAPIFMVRFAEAKPCIIIKFPKEMEIPLQKNKITAYNQNAYSRTASEAPSKCIPGGKQSAKISTISAVFIFPLPPEALDTKQ